MNHAGIYTYTISSQYTMRRELLKKRIILCCLTLTLLVAGVLIGSNLLASSNSEAQGSKNIYKYYTSIRVEAGDTLWSIADRYLSPESHNSSDRTAYMEELIALNSLTDTKIHTGQYLTVSYYSEEKK